MNQAIRECAVDIVEIFEDLLDEKEINVPCEDWGEESERRINESSARVYGSEYGNLIDKIEDRLEALKEDLK